MARFQHCAGGSGHHAGGFHIPLKQSLVLRSPATQLGFECKVRRVEVLIREDEGAPTMIEVDQTASSLAAYMVSGIVQDGFDKTKAAHSVWKR